MAFRHPLRGELGLIRQKIEPHIGGRGLDGAAARMNLRLLSAFVDQVEAERDANTPAAHLLNAQMIAAVNMLAATIAYTMPTGERLRAVPEVMALLQEKVAGRLSASKDARVFSVGLDPQSGGDRK
jgi:hypothetical protein